MPPYSYATTKSQTVSFNLRQIIHWKRRKIDIYFLTLLTKSKMLGIVKLLSFPIAPWNPAKSSYTADLVSMGDIVLFP